jgi:hypothetical protein
VVTFLPGFPPELLNSFVFSPMSGPPPPPVLVLLGSSSEYSARRTNYVRPHVTFFWVQIASSDLALEHINKP